jgi:hypothetical protein
VIEELTTKEGMQLLKLLRSRISRNELPTVPKKISNLSPGRGDTFENRAFRTESSNCVACVVGSSGTDYSHQGPMATHRSGFSEDFKSFLDIGECSKAKEQSLEEDIIAFESTKLYKSSNDLSFAGWSDGGEMLSRDSSTSLHF